jgi:uncharacterized membrane protein YphA (DoxX/SURF4 family)
MTMLQPDCCTGYRSLTMARDGDGVLVVACRQSIIFHRAGSHGRRRRRILSGTCCPLDKRIESERTEDVSIGVRMAVQKWRSPHETQEDRMSLRWTSFSSTFLRYALGLGFLSAVADRFGLWGPIGQPNVSWGNFSQFLEYTATLNPYAPAAMIPALGVIATGAEILFGLLLLVGWHTRATALLSGLLLLLFGVSMALVLGVKAPLNYAVFAAAGRSFLLATCERFPFSVDELLIRRAPRGRVVHSGRSIGYKLNPR